jgi:ectoine hydroxylase-related dioxygenase (phytanoyl-CoA dioxygenase family)
MTRRAFISDAQEQEFRERGYVLLKNLLNEAERTELIDAFNQSRNPNASGFHASLYTNDFDARKIVCPKVQAIMERALRGTLQDHRVCLGNVMCKEPDETSEMPLHQDWSFVDEPEYASVHVWTALVDVDSTNGCLAVVPGSQHLSDPVRAFGDDVPFREVFPLLREKYLKELPMRAGDAVAYDGRLVHASRVNSTLRRRLAAQCIAVPREAVVSHCWRVSPTQVQMYYAPDDFFLRYVLHQAPEGLEPRRLIDYEVKQLTPEQVSALDVYVEVEAV